MSKHNKNRPINTENILMASRWEEGRYLGEKGEGIKKYILVVIENHGNIK